MPQLNQFKKLLAIFDSNIDELTAFLTGQSKFPSLESLLTTLTTNAANNLKMDSAQQAACLQLVTASIRHDKVTDLYDGSLDQLLINAANIYSRKHKKNSFIIEGDFSNLYNCNKALGKTRTNQIMALIIDIYEQELGKFNSDLVYGSRSGGDEFRFTVIGIKEKQLKAAVDKAQTRIHSLVNELGIANLEHSKYKNDPLRKGVGACLAYKKLPVDFPSYRLQQELDQQIELNKLTIGKFNLKKNPQKNKIDLPIDQPQHIVRIDQILSNYFTKLNRVDNKEFPFMDITCDAQQHNRFIIRQSQTIAKAEMLGMNDKQAALLNNLLLSLYDKKDDKTGLYSNDDFIKSLIDYQNFSKSNKLAAYLIKFEAYNFSSLNAIFSHYGNDVMFKHMADILQQKLTGTNAVIFNRGGGIIAPILEGSNKAEINNMITDVINSVYEEIGYKSIKEYSRLKNIAYSAEALAKFNINPDTLIKDIPNFRGFKKGSGFIVAKQDLRKAKDFNETLAKLDKQTDENKISGLAYKTSSRIFYLSGENIKLPKIALSNPKDIGEVVNTSKISKGNNHNL